MSAILEFADKLRSQVDIADVVGRYVELRRLGTNLKGLCPFHNEKTPSFTVSTSKQIFHCFGCHEGGDVIKFVQKVERLEWMDALRHLARENGIALPEFSRDRADRETTDAQRDERESAIAAVEFAATFFQRHLKEQVAAGGEIRAYLNRRGIGPDTVEQFSLGLAPDAWTGLMDSATRAGHSRESLLNSGLATRHATKDRTYDRFRKRLIFPIHDAHGKPIAFGARVYAADAAPDEPKYINSPETLAYHKGQALYALHLAKESITKLNKAVLTEGYMDVIAAHRAGITNCVASCGTALTDEQARLLKRFCSSVVFLYDGDEAGQKAMLRGTEILLAQGLTVSIVTLPDGHDPDSFITEHGAEKLQERLDQAANFFDHFLGVAASRFDLRSAEGKVQAVEMLLPLLRRLKQAIAKNDYAHRLADRLQVDSVLIQRQLNSQNPNSIDRLRQVVTASQDNNDAVIEKTLLKLMVECPAARIHIKNKIDPQWLRDGFVRKWYAICGSLSPDEIAWETLMRNDAVEHESELAQLRSLAITDHLCDSSEHTIDHVAARIHRHYLREQSIALSQEIDAFFQGAPQDDLLLEKLRHADEHVTPVRPLLSRYFIKSDTSTDRH
jgi:DNA primase